MNLEILYLKSRKKNLFLSLCRCHDSTLFSLKLDVLIQMDYNVLDQGKKGKENYGGT